MAWPRTRRRGHRRNPTDYTTPALLLGGLLYLANNSKLALPTWPAPEPPRAQIVTVNHSTPVKGQAIDLEWVINHKGGAEHYIVGVGIGYWLGPFFRWNQQIEADMFTWDDPEWASYTVGLTAIVTVSDDKIEAYIRNLGGQMIDKRFV